MKRKLTMKKFLVGALLLCGIAFSGNQVYAAETEFTPASVMTDGPELGLNNDGYFAKTDGVCYASFVTPAEGGYLEIDYKNLTIKERTYATVFSAAGENLANKRNYENESYTFRFRSEPGKRNGAVLEPNTRYYIELGNADSAGNVKFVLRFTVDTNPDGKEQAEEVQLNREYTRSIDGYVGEDNDDDYFKFTASSSGVHRFKMVNACSDTIYYCVRKWNSDEYVKRMNGNDMNSKSYANATGEFDITLEAGQTYYLDVWGSTKGNYTFLFNDQRVQSINMPATSVTLNYGESYTLEPTISPEGAYNKTLKYTCDDTNVAYVNESTGVITAKNPGKAIIAATATDGSDTKAQFIVYVTPSKPGTPYYSKVTNTSIKLNWYAVNGADGYVVYRKSGNKWKAIKDTKSTSYNVKKLKAGSKYQFRIKAYVNADGKKYSVNSDITKIATTPKKTSITKISRLSKKSSSYGAYYRAKITWKKVSGATGYRLYYKASGSSYKYLYKECKGTSATVQFYKSNYSSSSLKYTFYVVPIKKYEGTIYTGSYSKGKTYTFK